MVGEPTSYKTKVARTGGRGLVSMNAFQCGAMSWNCHRCDLLVVCEFCESCSEHCAARPPNEIDTHCAYFGAMLARSTVLTRPPMPESTGARIVPVAPTTVLAGCRALAPLF